VGGFLQAMGREIADRRDQQAELGGYRMVREAWQGGMGLVFLSLRVFPAGGPPQWRFQGPSGPTEGCVAEPGSFRPGSGAGAAPRARRVMYSLLLSSRVTAQR